jgi:hypothetical protein
MKAVLVWNGRVAEPAGALRREAGENRPPVDVSVPSPRLVLDGRLAGPEDRPDEDGEDEAERGDLLM